MESYRGCGETVRTKRTGTACPLILTGLNRVSRNAATTASPTLFEGVLRILTAQTLPEESTTVSRTVAPNGRVSVGHSGWIRLTISGIEIP